jgi:hypothetical protein
MSFEKCSELGSAGAAIQLSFDAKWKWRKRRGKQKKKQKRRRVPDRLRAAREWIGGRVVAGGRVRASELIPGANTRMGNPVSTIPVWVLLCNVRLS